MPSPTLTLGLGIARQTRVCLQKRMSVCLSAPSAPTQPHGSLLWSSVCSGAGAVVSVPQRKLGHTESPKHGELPSQRQTWLLLLKSWKLTF